MRFVWAAAAFVLAALMIGAGIAQRTIFEAPSAESASIQTDSDAAYTLVDGAVLTMIPGAQTLAVEGDGDVFVAYGREADVTAWLAGTEYNHVTLGVDGQIDTDTVAAEVEPTPAPTESAAAEPAPETTTDAAAEDEAEDAARTPVGSDLWLDEFVQSDRLSTPLNLPETMSVLVASDGVEPAPATITVTWPVDSSTPWAGPLIIGGGFVLLVGVVLYVLGIRHARRSRGPRRKGLPLPQTEPIDVAAIDDADKGVISSGAPRKRRALLGGRRGFAVVGGATVSAVLLAGCSADAWPQLEPTGSPSPSASVIVPEGQQQPAVTEAQAERILSRVSTTVAEADAALDPAMAATRLSGAALAERETNYALRAAIAEEPALAPIPDQPVEIVLPQQSDSWPRSFLSVVEGADSTAAPTIMVLTQDDPWADYKTSYIASLEASTSLPDLAAPYVGAVLAPPESPFLAIPPNEVAAAYADVIDNGEASPYAAEFDIAGDPLLASIQAERQSQLDFLNQTGSGTSSLESSASAGSQAPLALTTLDGGAIVAVDVFESETVRPTNEDAVIRLPDNPEVRALTGLEQSAKGFTTTYIDQLFLYIPLQDSNEQIRLLGYRSQLLDAKEIE